MKTLAVLISGFYLILNSAYASTYECVNLADSHQTLKMTPTPDGKQITLVRGTSTFLFEIDTSPQSEPYRAYTGLTDDEPTYGMMLTSLLSSQPIPAQFDCAIEFRKEVAPGKFTSEGGSYRCKASQPGQK